jgi:hypothetical protein
MNANAIVLTKLFDTLNKAYVIPSYQRPFAWEPSKAIDLLEAIRDDSNANPPVKLTSIGTFLFCNVPYAAGTHPFGNNTHTSTAPNTVWEVVDGQQRMTVLALIGYALKERLAALSFGASPVAYSPPLEFDQLFRTSRTMGGTRVPVLIRDQDNFDTGFQSDVSRLLNSFIGNEPFPPTGVGDRLMSTLNAVQNWVNTNLNATNFATFCTYFFSKCQCVQVEADDQDTAFSMFEPLNSTSEPLTAFEVYRSKAVRSLTPIPAFTETLTLLDYDNTRRDEVIGRSNTLIFAMAQINSGERPRVHFTQLKQYLDAHVDVGFIARFEKGAEFFRTIWDKQTATATWLDEETKNCIRFLKASGHSAAMPVLLRYFQTNAAQVPAVAKAIVAFYALWRPAFPTNSLPDIYRNLLSKGTPSSPKPDNMALDGGTLKSVTDLKTYFRTKLTARLGTPSAGQTYEDLWLEDPKQVYLDYEQLKTICRLFIFVHMGASIKSNLVPDDPWTDLEDMDHILAASTTPAPANINKVGNLTFLPSTVNKSIQAMAWAEKREVYKFLASALRPTPPPSTFPNGDPLPPAVVTYLGDPHTPCLGHLAPLSTNAAWNQSKIKTRTTAMLKSAWNVLYNQWLN